MDTERWRRIEAVFDEVLDLPESERASFLDTACAGDAELLREVRELVAREPTAGALLRNAVASEIRLLTNAAVAAQVGRRIGPFRLIRLLGEGGMGAVYLAERDDAQFHHRVAIKILSHAVGSPLAIARFRDERQILAALEHPNIVRLLDGGSTDDNLPYLVMEHIEGTTITRYANQSALSVHARVALVSQVCAGLAYAHQNLIVHRDIKPSNILVDIDGTPKLLDFGIAKLLTPTGSYEREAHTRTGFAMFTPEYASPEQARGDAVSTATDVYSVGAVLYELVTGQPPHQTTGSALEILRVICEVDPPRPSTVGPSGRDRGPNLWRRELAGDLDNIILKALHKEPARRYASVEQLSDDLGRLLDGLPVAARTATVGYRTRKFVRRNKGVVIAATLVIATLLGATGVSLRQARRADDQAERAEAERANAIAEANRARRAEARVQEQLDQLKQEQAARAKAEADARAKSQQVELSREQLQDALAKAQSEKDIAEKESANAQAAAVKAHEAETLAAAAARAEKISSQKYEVLYEKEREHVKQEQERVKALEEASRKITTKLP